MTKKNLPVLKVEDVMKEFDVSRMTVYRWMKEGKLPYRRLGGGRFVRFTVYDIKDFLERSRQDNFKKSVNTLSPKPA